VADLVVVVAFELIVILDDGKCLSTNFSGDFWVAVTLVFC
jgi:hypothetical protein